MSNRDYARARRFTVVGLIIVIVFDAAVVGFCAWGVLFGNFPTWIPFIPIVVGVPSIIFYWWSQKRRWPAHQL